ncbi:hypothetical protein BMT55_14815 [Listeria newyorkensis]|uniref:Uncharacterized protein n=2 Tax=Listeria newyorkensis TaxID=1497681 RepID=A0ABX4XIH1_9LIST|nr:MULTISPECIES: hypothetical protein [Listeria]KGL46519.1 hypothetical protein EP56_01275 [Listeriaceae bacterium FSL A5-0209]KGL46807.1 hypothetical protein EP58_00280 [Listeria newyorkensis]PNP88464.1 hypothetical protein BMT55_14815 [Listeria newyorkensis]RQW66780.1 hypothetical protein DUK53_09115 [Listeria sp. SHR_NRA_18]WAO20545.1 hypothetical protein OTR81_09555 [Listeria newyorkensis]
MDKVFFNGSLFIGALMLLIGIFKDSLLLTATALIFAIIAQHFYRKKYPKRNRSFKELLVNQRDIRK